MNIAKQVLPQAGAAFQRPGFIAAVDALNEEAVAVVALALAGSCMGLLTRGRQGDLSTFAPSLHSLEAAGKHSAH